MSHRLLSNLLPLLFLPISSFAQDCPITSVANIPGCWGEPGCAYVIAGDGQACPFDYCNCGGVAAPLLPSVIQGTTSLGCGSYTTKPTAQSCPTEKPSLENGGGIGNGGHGGNGNLPAQVTTGDPISTVSDAFKTDASAPTVTTFSYQGGALTYTRATFTSLQDQKDTKTITATVTKTQDAGNAVQTFIGPIVVGPGGLFWGPPGTAPDCIWPFCTQSGPPSGGGGAGGGGGGKFGCQDCAGGGGNGGNGGNGNGGDGQSSPEACPGGKKVKRSVSFSFLGDRLVKREEETLSSTNPLKDALNNFGADRDGNSFISSAIDSAEGILTNKFPKEQPNAYVTGLEGHYTLTQKLTIGNAGNQQTFQSGTRLFWRVRWDFDPAKGPHVNAQFGTNPSSKFAYSLDSSRFPEGENAAKRAMQDIVKELNKQCKYSYSKNVGKDTPTWDTTEENAIEDLKNHFKNVASGPCT